MNHIPPQQTTEQKILDILNKVENKVKIKFKSQIDKYETPQELSSLELMNLRHQIMGFDFAVEFIKTESQKHFNEFTDIYLDCKHEEWYKE